MLFTLLFFSLVIMKNTSYASNNLIQVEDIKINYTGGEDNLRNYIPKNLRNDTYKDNGDLHLLGSSIEVMGPKNEKFLRNIEYSIKVLEYLNSSIGMKKAADLGQELLNIPIYPNNSEYLVLESTELYGNAAGLGNPTLGDIFSNTYYIDPVINGVNDLDEDSLQEALLDLKEHQAIGATDNFILVFTQFNLIIIEVMAIMFLIFGGLVWLTAGGEENQIERGKKTILWAIIGMIGGLVAYVLLNVLVQVFTS